MSHLTAVKKVNKLGHSVTKYVKSQEAPGLGRKPLPAPVSVDPAISKQTTRDTMQALRDAGVPLLNKTIATKNIYHLANRNPELLERVTVHISNADSDEKAVWDEMLSNVQRHPVSRESSYDASLFYERDMTVFPVAAKIVENTDPAYASTVSKNIEMCLQGMEGDGTDEPAVLAASLIVMEYDRKFASPYNYAFDGEKYADDVAHIAEHPEEVAPILGELIKRETLDRDVIESIIGVSASSLREGAL